MTIVQRFRKGFLGNSTHEVTLSGYLTLQNSEQEDLGDFVYW